MMHKNIFLLSDQVIHWNIVPGADRKIVHLEHWGNNSIEKFMNSIQSHFNASGMRMDWSLLDNGMDIRESADLNPANAAYNHVFATWKQFPEDKTKAWRIDEIAHAGQSAAIKSNPALFDDLPKADLLMIQDWGMSIHDIPIPELEENFHDKWVIYRSFPPIFAGKLWNSIRLNLESRGIIALRANDLRMLDVSISKGLSWEQTIQDIITEIYCKRNLSLHPLQTAAYVIISFGLTGTLLLHNVHSPDGVNPTIQLFFDSLGVEDYWEIAHPGYLPGSMELLMVLLAKELLYPSHPDQPSFSSALRAHLLGSRALHLAGANIAEGSLNLAFLPDELKKVYEPQPTQDFTPVPLEFDLFKCLFTTKHGSTSSDKRLVITQ
jgi:hypothetical protein